MFGKLYYRSDLVTLLGEGDYNLDAIEDSCTTVDARGRRYWMVSAEDIAELVGLYESLRQLREAGDLPFKQVAPNVRLYSSEDCSEYLHIEKLLNYGVLIPEVGDYVSFQFAKYDDGSYMIRTTRDWQGIQPTNDDEWEIADSVDFIPWESGTSVDVSYILWNLSA